VKDGAAGGGQQFAVCSAAHATDIIRARMRLRTWPLLTIGFGILLLLIGASAAVLHSSLGLAYREVAAIQETVRTERELIDRVQSELFLTSVLVRDYLLESSLKSSSGDRATLQKLRASVEGSLSSLEKMSSASQRAQVMQLRKAITSYWQSLDPVFNWSPAQKGVFGRSFLRLVVLPHREAVLSAIERLGEISNRQGLERQQQVLKVEEDLKVRLRSITAVALFFGGAVAIASILRTRSLEAATTAYLVQIEDSAAELRRLSRKIAGAQEEERRRISRELHDQVGQMLTALGMELGNLDEFHQSHDPAFGEHIRQAKGLAEDTLRTVRNLSAGLRPSMLDELGLGPALQYQAREFTKRSGVAADVTLAGDLANLPDAHRTCVYRVVQEALTNAARHSGAKSIAISLRGGRHALTLSVRDDGRGFDPRNVRSRGFGLLGMEERVRELGGRFELRSRPGQGALLHCEIPIPPEAHSAD
jgi:signal transduction histidine kinase